MYIHMYVCSVYSVAGVAGKERERRYRPQIEQTPHRQSPPGSLRGSPWSPPSL